MSGIGWQASTRRNSAQHSQTYSSDDTNPFPENVSQTSYRYKLSDSQERGQAVQLTTNLHDDLRREFTINLTATTSGWDGVQGRGGLNPRDGRKGGDAGVGCLPEVDRDIWPSGSYHRRDIRSTQAVITTSGSL